MQKVSSLKFPPKSCVPETFVSARWGSSGSTEQRNLKKICRGIRNSSNLAEERRNSPSLPDLDFLENDTRNADFHEILWICGSFICCLVKKGRGHIYIFLVSTMGIFFKTCTRILTATLLLFSTWMDGKCLTIPLCAIIAKEVVGHGTVAKNDRNRGFLLKIARNGGFLPPLITPTARLQFLCQCHPGYAVKTHVPKPTILQVSLTRYSHTGYLMGNKAFSGS